MKKSKAYYTVNPKQRRMKSMVMYAIVWKTGNMQLHGDEGCLAHPTLFHTSAEARVVLEDRANWSYRPSFQHIGRIAKVRVHEVVPKGKKV